MAVFKCKICGGALEIDGAQSVATCEYCGTKQTLPRLDDERRANLYDRANHFRRNNDFDKAMGIYEGILNEDTTDAEAYWSILLCRYGIEYVKDPATKKRVPTVNRAQFTSIFDDEDYKSALANADAHQRELYEAEAAAINELQKGILAISQKEEPFDVFICYKETDNNGRRTQDSVLATELYHELTREGFKVFFSRITLEDKLGVAYEPYIFAALHSAKVMVVLGTSPEYFNAVWVKNEWSRYLALIKNGAKKTLIPAYRDMDPYDLPEEFSHLQAQDMSKLGFMQDLLHGIKKIVLVGTSKPIKPITVTNTSTENKSTPHDNQALLTRAFLFLEDGDFKSANDYCEKVLDKEPTNARAYLCKLMVDLRVKKQELLWEIKKSFENNNNYQKALRFADADLAKTLREYILHINYNAAVLQMEAAQTEQENREVSEKFKALSGYKDADKLARQCLEKADQIYKQQVYTAACYEYFKNKSDAMTEAAKLFKKISGYKDAAAKAQACLVKSKELKAREMRQKRIVKIASLVLLCFVVIAVFSVCLYQNLVVNVEQGGVKYKKDGNTYAVVEIDKQVSSVDIAHEIKGKPVTAIFDNAFENCIKLTSVTIPEGVISIGKNAFRDCSGLTSIIVPSTVTSIGEDAFSGCSSLKSITLPFSMNFKYIFDDNIPSSLKVVVITGGDSIVDSAFRDCNGIESITIRANITFIGAHAFRGCDKLQWVIFADSSQLRSIGDFAFYNCIDISSITIPASVTSIGSAAFSGCTGLTNITIPSSVTSIGSSAFSGCDELQWVIFADSSQLRLIDDYAFYGCTALSSITIPASVTAIGNSAFRRCDKLQEVIFAENSQLRSISDCAFYDCNVLPSIVIPEGVISIGAYAFAWCAELSSVTCAATSWMVSASNDFVTSLTVELSTLNLTSIYANYFWKRNP